MAAFEKIVNTPADSGQGTNNQPSWGIQNSNWDLAQQKLDEKADGEQTNQSLQALQTGLNDKASAESVSNLTQRVQENATRISEVANAAKPAELAGAGLQADTAGTKLEVKAGTGLSTQGGAVAVDIAGLTGAGLQVDAGGTKLEVKPGIGLSTQGGAVAVDVEELAGDGLQADADGTALEVNVGTGLIMQDGAVAVDLAELAGPGLQVDADGKKLEVNAGAGLEVSAQGRVQIAADFAETVNSKADEEALLAVAGVVGNLQTDKVDVSAKASSADIQNGVADKWVDAAGLKNSQIAFCAVGGTAQTIPYNAVTRLTGLTNISFNKGSGYSGNQFTAPVAGIYDIKGSISMAGTSGSAVSAPWSQILLYKNGASIGSVYNFGAVRSDGYGAIAGNWLVELAQGDILTLYLIQVVLSAGVSIGANANSFFAGALLR